MIRRAAVLALLALVAAACAADGGDDAAGGTVRVFAAASLTDAFTALGDAFEEANPGTTVEFNFASSSSLREQLLAGAPADVYASANAANMDAVVEAGMARDPVSFATNQIALAVPFGNPAGVRGLEDLADADLLIGLCAPEVPCGEFGRAVLANAGVTPAPDTEEPDVRSLLTKLGAGELDAGLVYASDVVAAGGSVASIDFPAEDNVVASYPIATLADGPAAAAFVDFVLSDEGRAVLVSFGFGVP